MPRFSIRSRDTRLLTVDFADLPTRYPYTLMVPQDVTETVLAARLEALGHGVHRPLQAIGIVQDHDGVEVTLRHAPGMLSHVRASYVVGTDGMHSTVRQAAGISFEGSVYEASFMLADVAMDWPLSPDEVNLFFSPDGFVVAAPLPRGRHRIVATMDEAPAEPVIADVQAILDARGPVREQARVRDLVWGSRFRVHHRLAGRYHEGRVVLAGDAAHVHSPAGGQGMNTGIIDAAMLAPRLAAVIEGARDHVALDEYEALRMPVAERVLSMSNRMTRVATMKNPALRTARNLGLRALGLVPGFARSLAHDLSGLRYPRD